MRRQKRPEKLWQLDWPEEHSRRGLFETGGEEIKETQKASET